MRNARNQRGSARAFPRLASQLTGASYSGYKVSGPFKIKRNVQSSSTEHIYCICNSLLHAFQTVGAWPRVLNRLEMLNYALLCTGNSNNDHNRQQSHDTSEHTNKAACAMPSSGIRNKVTRRSGYATSPAVGRGLAGHLRLDMLLGLHRLLFTSLNRRCPYREPDTMPTADPFLLLKFCASHP